MMTSLRFNIEVKYEDNAFWQSCALKIGENGRLLKNELFHNQK